MDTFSPVRPGTAGGPVPPLLDLTRPGQAALSPEDAGAVAALGDVPEAVALWRSWHTPGGAGEPVPVFLLQATGDAAGLPGITARLRDALTRGGVADPQVTVFGPDAELSGRQRQARGRSALLWTRAPYRAVAVARVYDSFDPVAGGQFAADHPVLSADDESARVLAYLAEGHVLLSTTARAADVFDEEAGPQVPMTVRTDGRWIWTDTIAYYLRTYALSPDQALMAHIRDRDHTYRKPDAVAEHRALVELHTPRGRDR